MNYSMDDTQPIPVVRDEHLEQKDKAPMSPGEKAQKFTAASILAATLMGAGTLGVGIGGAVYNLFLVDSGSFQAQVPAQTAAQENTQLTSTSKPKPYPTTVYGKEGIVDYIPRGDGGYLEIFTPTKTLDSVPTTTTKSTTESTTVLSTTVVESTEPNNTTDESTTVLTTDISTPETTESSQPEPTVVTPDTQQPTVDVPTTNNNSTPEDSTVVDKPTQTGQEAVVTREHNALSEEPTPLSRSKMSIN